MRSRDETYVKIVPAPRQMEHQQTEFYAFFHFGMNTYTGREWGDGSEDPSVFRPTDMDAGQWAEAVKAAGMKGAILTCKHHDGFCLWPSRWTDHSVASSPYQDGKGDIVKEVSDAYKKEGLKFGVYLSPWDRHEASYGSGRAYDDYFVNQMAEILTQYGDIFCVWFDGAYGEGPEGRRQEYDWERYYDLIRKLQPEACIAVCGPDIRWCGNEAGDVRESEWSVVPLRLKDAERVQAASQQEDGEEFREKKIRSSEQDLGSRKALEGEEDLIWYPAEVNTSIRPGWFYHAEEDSRVKTLEELMKVYYGSVGGNGTLLLNLPPAPNGLLAAEDVARLKEMGGFLREAFDQNLVEMAEVKADAAKEGCGIEHVRTDSYETWYQPEEGQTKSVIEVKIPEAKKLRHIVMKENIRLSQRIERYEVFAGTDGALERIYEGSVVGYKKIIPLKDVCGDTVIISITDARVCPTLSFVGIYE